ncbi:hypothetical protein CR513_08054, partial [Mucuna pruriens]
MLYGHTELHTGLVGDVSLLDYFEEGVLSRLESGTVQFTDGPFVITHVFPYGVVELRDENTNSTFQVNGHQIKLFHEGPTPTMAEMESISLMELVSSSTDPLYDLDPKIELTLHRLRKARNIVVSNSSNFVSNSPVTNISNSVEYSSTNSFA